MMVLIETHYNEQGQLISRQWIDTLNAPQNMCGHPTKEGERLTHLELWKLCNTDEDVKELAGFNVTSQAHEESAPKTRWQRMVEAQEHPDAPEHFKALQLVHTPKE